MSLPVAAPDEINIIYTRRTRPEEEGTVQNLVPTPTPVAGTAQGQSPVHPPLRSAPFQLLPCLLPVVQPRTLGQECVRIV